MKPIASHPFLRQAQSRFDPRTILLAALGLVAAAGPAAAACTGDCNGDHAVTVDELVVGVNIALGTAPVAQCAAFDADGDGQTTVNELVRAVGAALDGCPPDSGTPTPTPTPRSACAGNDGTASITASAARPASGNGPFAVSCVTVGEAEPGRPELTQVSVAARVGSERGELLIQLVTATGTLEAVTYQWAESPSNPRQLVNLAFCFRSGCSGVTVDREARSVTLTATRLEGPVGEKAQIDGSIQWRGD